jgi:hypothetical protein
LPGQDFTGYSINLPPVAPQLYDNDGSLNWAPDPLRNGISSWFNPLSKLQYLFDTKAHNLVSNARISYRLAPGFEISSNLGFVSFATDQFVAALDGTLKPENRVDRFRQASFGINSSYQTKSDVQITFERKFGEHNVNLIAGADYQYQNNNGKRINTSGHSSDILLKNMVAGTGITVGYDVNEYKYVAGYGRIGYSYKGKYLSSFSARRDGSTRFGPNNRFNNFWSIGGGWILSEEKFLKELYPIVSFAKIRGSYGTTGNDQIGDYQFMNLYFFGFPQIPYQNGGFGRPLTLSNPDLQWEDTRKLQVGIDFGFWNDRVIFTSNYTRNRTSNSITNYNLPVVTGFNMILRNLPALIQNTGLEFLLNSVNVKGEFEWRTSANLTVPKNKLINFPGLENSSMKGQVKIGRPLSGSYNTYPYYGVNPSTGFHMVMDRFGNPTSTPSTGDATVLVDLNSKFYGGIQNSFLFKGFSLDIFIQFSKQLGNRAVLSPPGRIVTGADHFIAGNQLIEVTHRWQKPGDVTNFQRYTTLLITSTSGDRNIEDISYAKLKNVSISYSFPTKITTKLKMQQLMLYSNAQNLYTLTRYKGFDPETQNLRAVPPLRMITVGIKATF